MKQIVLLELAAPMENVGRQKDCLFHTFDDVATAAYARETAPQRK